VCGEWGGSRGFAVSLFTAATSTGPTAAIAATARATASATASQHRQCKHQQASVSKPVSAV